MAESEGLFNSLIAALTPQAQPTRELGYRDLIEHAFRDPEIRSKWLQEQSQPSPSSPENNNLRQNQIIGEGAALAFPSTTARAFGGDPGNAFLINEAHGLANKMRREGGWK